MLEFWERYYAIVAYFAALFAAIAAMLSAPFEGLTNPEEWQAAKPTPTQYTVYWVDGCGEFHDGEPEVWPTPIPMDKIQEVCWPDTGLPPEGYPGFPPAGYP